jgi:hypothetical protein
MLTYADVCPRVLTPSHNELMHDAHMQVTCADVYVYLGVVIYVYICALICMYTCAHARVSIRQHTSAHAYASTCQYICALICMYTCVHMQNPLERLVKRTLADAADLLDFITTPPKVSRARSPSLSLSHTHTHTHTHTGRSCSSPRVHHHTPPKVLSSERKQADWNA